MTRDQIDLFGAAPPPVRPEGFCYESGLLSAEEERTLLERVRALPFREFEFHGHVGRRRTVSYGWSYDFGAEALREADDMPPFLVALRERAADFADLAPARARRRAGRASRAHGRARAVDRARTRSPTSTAAG